MIKKHAFVVLLIPSIFFAQQERYPIFDVCKGSQIQSLKDCFYTTTRKYFFSEFKSPKILKNEGSMYATLLFTIYRVLAINSCG